MKYTSTIIVAHVKYARVSTSVTTMNMSFTWFSSRGCAPPSGKLAMTVNFPFLL
jgi:hypothetical protein